MATWTENIPGANDTLATSQPNIKDNFSELNTAIALEHIAMTNATETARGSHRFRVGDSTAQAAITSGVVTTGAVFIRTDTNFVRWDYYDGDSWESLGVNDATQTIIGTKTFGSPAIFTETVLLGADPTTALQAATKQYVDGNAQVQLRQASVTDVTRATEQTIDGVLTSDTTILLKNQANLTENGFYTTASGNWTRIAGFSTVDSASPGTLAAVQRGTINANTLWQLDHDGTNDTITPGTHDQAFTRNKGSLTQITQAFTSADLTITAGASTGNIAHGLGAEPVVVQAFLKNVNTEHAYTTGQMVPIHYSNRDGTFTGVSIIVDATNITVRFSSSASSFDIIKADDGSLQGITNANWTLVIKAIA